jgi:hypothetical protein
VDLLEVTVAAAPKSSWINLGAGPSMFHSVSLIHTPRSSTVAPSGPYLCRRLSVWEILDEADEGCIDLVRALLLSPVTAAT